MEIRQKLHDLEFQTGSDFDLDQVMQKLDYIINSHENEIAVTPESAEAVIAIDIVRRDENILRQVQNAELVAAHRSKNAHVLDRDVTMSQLCYANLNASSLNQRNSHVSLMLIRCKTPHCDSDQLDEVVLLLYSGAQNSFITNSTVQRLGIKVSNPKPRSFVAFGGRIDTEVSGTVQLLLVDAIDETLEFELTTKDVITFEQIPPHLDEKDLEFIHDHGFQPPSCQGEPRTTMYNVHKQN
ncbi:unnamed protein product [Heligmosomoides polygyrus]|uniref:DUF1758 domain-containing protein n=1 Tax=Heligmosomoides polygyrus TaxID=6339 RepID=A0A183GX24_HELPZ|nr:unnamed protein product [Heligmosomoides polygyrus]